MKAPLPDKKLGLDEEEIKAAFAELQPAIQGLIDTYNVHVVISALASTYLGLLQEAGLPQDRADTESRRIQALLSRHRYNRRAAASALEAIGHFCTRLSRRGISARASVWIVGDAMNRIISGMRDGPVKKDLVSINLRLAGLQISCLPANR
ncbi:hypothetical protein [Methylocaldum marinum]|uniref:hypothetical protein n=1 Tax=Methylocaldum marinum TaxID=1432792 RepID=UPI0011AE6C9F|nr:hypothetical protein [Methylocaldum marinum]